MTGVPPAPKLPDAIAPIVIELDGAVDSEQAFLRLADKPRCVFLDSALNHPRLGRYSFLAADPFDFVTAPTDDRDALRFLKERLAGMNSTTIADLPPFQGGAAGFLSYDLGLSFEHIPTARFDEFAAPALAFGLYDVVLAIDRVDDRAWIISHGWPEKAPTKRRRRAAERAEQFRQWLTTPALANTTSHRATTRLDTEQLAPQYAFPGGDGVTSDFSREDYLKSVEQCVEYVLAGDLFQVNLSQRLLSPAIDDPVSLYLRLRQRNPATFAGYFDAGDLQLCSASPERFVMVTGDRVETRPIKGTRRRLVSPEANLFAGDVLLASDKDRAENVMIVDLLRNDLSRVCRAESIRVTELCSLEQYATVQHLVSAVEGKLADGKTATDLIRAAFPGGSITGAPKVRAMEIIAELEPTARGPYCGSLGYVGFDGAVDLSILIRTIVCSKGWWQLPAGGGIVAQSQPAAEYEETLDKAAGLLKALKP
jgi:para-aminobenzoate synthetase component 1